MRTRRSVIAPHAALPDLAQRVGVLATNVSMAQGRHRDAAEQKFLYRRPPSYRR